MMRNELFGRLLYLVVNTFFAKVCNENLKNRHTYYFWHSYPIGTLTIWLLVATVVVQTRLHICFTASWGNSFWMRDLGLCVANIQSGLDLYRSQRQQLLGAGYGCSDKPCGCHLNLERIALGQEHAP